VFFSISSVQIAIVLSLLLGGSTAVGLAAGRRLRGRIHESRESVGVVQGTLLGFLGLLLAFGMTMAVGRYDIRRALVVEESNAIGTTYLRAQMLEEPMRTESLDLLRTYTDRAIELVDQVPDSRPFVEDLATMGELQRQLWAAAGEAVAKDPTGTAPRLYVEALNPMIDANGERVASVRNRVPTTVMVLQVVGSAVALGVLAFYLALLGRGGSTSIVATIVVALILFISFDLDRPHRGLIQVPDTPLVATRATMDPPPAAGGP
jgi:hypothetical protein